MYNDIFKPPMNIARRDMGKKHLFLAGSIEEGKAEDWQSEITPNILALGWGVFNPRREKWANCELVHDDPNFFEQVSWESNALRKSDYILMNFVGNTISPISLLELGLHAKSGKIAVVCSLGYFRLGNVEMTCLEHDIPLFYWMSDFMEYFKTIA